MNPPPNLKALCDSATLLHKKGDLADAALLYLQVLAVEPANFSASHMLGVLRFQEGQKAEALELIGAALKINPESAPALLNHGNVLRDLGRHREALASYEKALALKPNFALAHYNRGAALQELKRFDEALVSYDRALALKPDYFEVLNNYAGVLRHFRRYDEALACYERALAIKPDDTEILNNRGSILQALGRFDEALASYDRALAIKPDHARTLYNRGILLWTEMRRYEPAVLDLERAAVADTEFDYLRGDLLRLRLHGADWRDYEQQVTLIGAGVSAGQRVATPFMYQGIADSPANLQACSRIYAGHLYPSAAAPPIERNRGHTKIRIGYLSGEFSEHPVAYLMAGLYELHDRSRFEIVAFDNGGPDKSPTRKRLKAAFDRFIDISTLSDEAAAEKIRSEEIDILVNLNGYSGLFRMGVFARKPAPVQVNYLGFPGTLGANYIDYIIADCTIIPEDERRYYTESVVHMPGSFMANDAKRRIAEIVPSRAANGLPENSFVFCNFNQGYKLTPAIFAAWMRILGRVPESVLWMPENTPKFQENIRREAASHGIAAERFVFAPVIAMDNHLARLRLVDLGLDTMPYNMHATASDALWAGMPFVTCRGTTFPSRVAASLLQAVGLPELVTESLADYETLAVNLAGDPALLKSIRLKLAQNRLSTPLFDTDRFCRNIESAYATMWEIWQQGESPHGFSVGEA